MSERTLCPPTSRQVSRAIVLAACAAIFGACQTSAGATWPAFGTYRLPYADGTEVKVSRDFTTHDPLGRYDLKGQGDGPFSIVASAPGWVRVISDQNAGGDEVFNNFVWIEHPYPFCQPDGVTWPGKPADYDETCIECLGEFCNEWTKYSHLETDSASGDARLSVGQFVQAGTFLGSEGSVGTTAQHLHWEVAKLNPDDLFHNTPDGEGNGWPHDWSDDGWVGSPDLLPTLCGVPGHLDQGEVHAAVPCPAASKARSAEFVLTQVQHAATLSLPQSLTGVLKFTGPDRRNRITLHSFDLDLPVPIDGSSTLLTDARLIRPVTIALAADGTARVPADQVMLAYAVSPPLAPSILISNGAGPLPGGYLDLSFKSGRLAFAYAAGPWGLVRGDAMPR
jgi:hypothetical protein